MMYPEVEAYVKAKNEASVTRDERRREIAATLDVARREAGCCADPYSVRLKYNNDLHQADRDWHVAVNTAWNAMRRDPSDPLVTFIVDECKEYQEQALEVLEALPAKLDDLNALASRCEWCYIWDQFRDKAMEAGLFPEVARMSAARRAMRDWFRNEITTDGEDLRDLMRHLNAVIAEESGVKVTDELPIEVVDTALGF